MFEIFTDSSSNLPYEYIEKNGIKVVTFTYFIDGERHEGYVRGEDFDGATFYSEMRGGAHISTSMINVGDFCDAFSAALGEGRDVLYLGMSGGISGAFNASVLAAEELADRFPDRKIIPVNTRAASLGEGMAVIEAVKQRQLGADIETAAAAVEKYCDNICQYFIVDDLKYLRRGGRIPAALAFVGSVLNVKPILTGSADGHIVSCGKAIGRRRALEALADKYALLAADKSSDIFIAHADCSQQADMLVDMLSARGFNGRCVRQMYEPVTGSHVGPGALALFFFGTEK